MWASWLGEIEKNAFYGNIKILNPFFQLRDLIYTTFFQKRKDLKFILAWYCCQSKLLLIWIHLFIKEHQYYLLKDKKKDVDSLWDCQSILPQDIT